jgi:hypothetical protein
MPQKPVKKPTMVRGCESCLYREGDFYNDETYPDIVRCYCKARHINVDAEAMSKDCDFYSLDPDHEVPAEKDTRYGL